MKDELNWMLKDIKENVYDKPKRTVLINLIFSFTIGIVFVLVNLYLFILIILSLYLYWYYDAHDHCKTDKKDVDRLFNPPA